jgi:hypothetical protein
MKALKFWNKIKFKIILFIIKVSLNVDINQFCVISLNYYNLSDFFNII